jgi:hypothetical protein
MYQEKYKFSTKFDEKDIPSLSKFKRICILLNSLAVINLVVMMRYSSYFDLTLFFIIPLLLPILGCCLVFYSKGVVRFFKKRDTPFPSIFLLFLLSALSLFIPVFSLYGEVLDILFLCVYTSLLTSILFGTYLLAEKRHFAKIKFKEERLYFFVIFLSYSYCLIMFLNIWFDTNNPTSTEFGIANRYEENGNYYLELENDSWREVDNSNRIEIGKFIYKVLEKEESVTVKTCDGFLGISWFYYDIFD